MNSELFIIEFVLFILFYCLLNTSYLEKFIYKRNNYYLLLLLALIFQLLSAGLLSFEVGDVRLFSSVGWFLRQGQNIYFIDQGSGSYPFFPFLIFIHAFLNLIAETFKIFTFSFYLKAMLLIPSLYFIAFQIEDKLKRLQFLAHPLVYLIVIFHGQIDILLIVLVVLSVNLIKKRLFLGSFIYALSILTKTWSVVFIPSIIKNLHSTINIFKFFITIFIVIFIDIFIYTRLFNSSFTQGGKAVIAAGGSQGIWGLTYIFPSVTNYSFVLFLLLYIVGQFIILKKKRFQWVYYLLTVLSILIIIPKWGVQYLFWMLPFLYLEGKIIKSKEFIIFTVISSIYAFASYFNIVYAKEVINSSTINILGLFIWIFLIFWFFSLQKMETIKQ